jgi:nucleoside-diphosphate kinase
MVWERTFAMLKPDCVQRGMVGEVLGRLERKGLRIAAMKLIWVTRAQAEQHYAVHKGLSFYDRLISYLTSGPTVALVLEGMEAVTQLRHQVGATKPLEAAPGTIRGDLALDMKFNLIHASDSQASAQTEIAVYFSADEILDYARAADSWVVLD